MTARLRPPSRLTLMLRSSGPGREPVGPGVAAYGTASSTRGFTPGPTPDETLTTQHNRRHHPFSPRRRSPSARCRHTSGTGRSSPSPKRSPARWAERASMLPPMGATSSLSDGWKVARGTTVGRALEHAPSHAPGPAGASLAACHLDTAGPGSFGLGHFDAQHTLTDVASTGRCLAGKGEGRSPRARAPQRPGHDRTARGPARPVAATCIRSAATSPSCWSGDIIGHDAGLRARCSPRPLPGAGAPPHGVAAAPPTARAPRNPSDMPRPGADCRRPPNCVLFRAEGRCAAGVGVGRRRGVRSRRRRAGTGVAPVPPRLRTPGKCPST